LFGTFHAPNKHVAGADEMRKSFFLSSLFCLSACSVAAPETDLIGSYIANYGGEIATLMVRADYTYTHTVVANGRQISEQVSTWKVTQLSSGWVSTTAVDFRDFFPVPSFGDVKKGKKGGWVPEVDQSWLGQIRLCFDSDVGYCYVKHPS
jgi:hypothetical protein